ncbi:hypothetical protein EMGBS3_10570 [Anaerolineaceae bacterium]|nr:hypothetical protein EMGBS3_10570 [Anaerolineaceae bacterium]GBL37066.1 hypothetical protein EMGBD1_07530 [Anaerolineaceae bacterium]
MEMRGRCCLRKRASTHFEAAAAGLGLLPAAHHCTGCQSGSMSSPMDSGLLIMTCASPVLLIM